MNGSFLESKNRIDRMLLADFSGITYDHSNERKRFATQVHEKRGNVLGREGRQMREGSNIKRGDAPDRQEKGQELMEAFSRELMRNPERMAVLFQMVFALTEQRWEELHELTYLYGSGLKPDNLFGRKLFIQLVLFLNEKEMQAGNC